jgi:hypothetical protein
MQTECQGGAVFGPEPLLYLRLMRVGCELGVASDLRDYLHSGDKGLVRIFSPLLESLLILFVVTFLYLGQLPSDQETVIVRLVW